MFFFHSRVPPAPVLRPSLRRLHKRKQQLQQQQQQQQQPQRQRPLALGLLRGIGRIKRRQDGERAGETLVLTHKYIFKVCGTQIGIANIKNIVWRKREKIK